jgi:molybdopterin/thiamine biosynthesis adenylyltransferase
MTDRDNRNELVWGAENQQKLYDTKVMVVGSDILSQMILAGCAGLSVGHINFVDNKRISRQERDFLCLHSNESIGQKKVRHIEETLKKINATLTVHDRTLRGIYSKFTEAFVYGCKPELIIDGTNDPISKEKALNYAIQYNIPFISASSDNEKSAVAAYFPVNTGKIAVIPEKPDLEALLMKEFEGSRQEGFTSGVMAGIVCEEIRKLKFKYTDNGQDDNLPSNERIVYNLYSGLRKGMKSDEGSAPVYFKNKKALIVGGGGIGNFVALDLALLGLGHIDILDLDTVEGHNLNRQVLLYDRVGQRKADVLADRVKELDPVIQSDSIFGKIGEVYIERDKDWLERLYEEDKKMWNEKDPTKREPVFPKFREYVKEKYELNIGDREKGVNALVKEQEIASRGYDIIFGCLDNKYARLWLNNFAVNYTIPYIDGGTGPKSGQLAVYVPGKTKCIDCQMHLINYPPPRSCAEGPEGSVVMSNLVIGSMMVGEAIRAMYSIGSPILSDLKYTVMLKDRFFLRTRKGVLATEHKC